jgi:hypothetical protein
VGVRFTPCCGASRNRLVNGDAFGPRFSFLLIARQPSRARSPWLFRPRRPAIFAGVGRQSFPNSHAKLHFIGERISLLHFLQTRPGAKVLSQRCGRVIAACALADTKHGKAGGENLARLRVNSASFARRTEQFARKLSSQTLSAACKIVEFCTQKKNGFCSAAQLVVNETVALCGGQAL